jgi:hypothetical protein
LGRHWAALLVLVAAWLAPAWGQAQDSTLTRLIRQNQYALVPSGPQFSGPGWDIIQASIQASQFVLVGEDHGLAQVPAFATAVAQVLQPVVYVAEIDPYVAQELTQLVAQPGPPTAYLQRYPEGLCFFDWAEEFELLRTLCARQVRLVGLDQVYCTTTAPFYARLAAQVKGAAAKRYLQERATAYEAQNQRFEKLGADEWAMFKQSAAALDSLLLLTKKESPALRRVAQDYVASSQIYAAAQRGAGHQLRVNLLKRNLLAALRPYQTADGLAAPKMLFKFGSNHLARGLSQSVKGEYYDIGNVMQTMADVQAQKSLHLYIVGKQGERAESDNPYFPAKRTGTYTATTENAELLPYLSQVTGPAWAVFDLRPVRRAITAGRLRVASQSLQRSIMGYDYLIVIPETTASHAM